MASTETAHPMHPFALRFIHFGNQTIKYAQSNKWRSDQSVGRPNKGNLGDDKPA